MMKKLFLTSALAAMLTVAQAAVTTYETTNSNLGTKHTGSAGAHGFSLVLASGLDNSRLSSTQVGDESLIPNMTVRLDGIKLTIATVPSAVTNSGFGLAMIDNTGKVLALAGIKDSDDTLVKNTGDVVWTFGGEEVNTSDKLYFVFYKGGKGVDIGSQMNTSNGITGGILDMYNYDADGDDVDNSDVDTLVNIRLTTSGPVTQSLKQFAPDLTIYTSYGTPDGEGGGTDNVPEPTSATLSLLALAGLAARRRRK